MKFLAVIGAALLAVASAVPQVSNESPVESRFIDGIVASQIENLAQQLKDNGYDPYHFEGAGVEYALARNDVLDLSAAVDSIDVIGVSDIVINRMSWGLFTFVLTYDVSLPTVTIRIGNAGFDATVLNNDFQGRLSGQIVLNELGVAGTARVSILSLGVSALNVNVYLNSITSQIVQASLLGMDYSYLLNQFISGNVYRALIDSQEGINVLAHDYAWGLLQDLGYAR